MACKLSLSSFNHSLCDLFAIVFYCIRTYWKLTKDVTFSILTDIQISERAQGLAITENVNSKLKQGTSGNVTVTSTQTTNWKKYQTRILSTANQANLKFKDAEPKLVEGLLRSISGLF